MAPQQGTPSGVPYSRRLFDLADAAWSRGGPLTEPFVKSLWKVVAKGGRISWVERCTLEYIREEYNLSDGAKAMLDDRLLSHFSRTIHGKRYDKGLLDEASRRSRAGKMGKQDLVELWKLANDLRPATPVQLATLEFVLQSFKLSLAARLYLVGQLRAASKQQAGSVSSSASSSAARPRPPLPHNQGGGSKRRLEGATSEEERPSSRARRSSEAAKQPAARWSFLSQIWKAIAGAATRRGTSSG